MGGGPPAQDTYASSKQAAVSKEMYDYYKTNFQPLEGQLINEMNDPALVTGAVGKAAGLTGQVFNASGAAQTRESSRYGINMTPDRVASTARGNDLARGLSTVSNSNSARRGVDEYKTTVLQNTASMGRQTATQGLQGFSTAAGLEANRNRTNRNAAAQQDSQNMQLAGTAAMAALALW
ncbi:MAG: hypothetical protein R8M45_02175 [Ghiorsea sp.]